MPLGRIGSLVMAGQARGVQPFNEKRDASRAHASTLEDNVTLHQLWIAPSNRYQCTKQQEAIGVARGLVPQFLAYLVVLCFEKRCPEQNTVARLKSKYLAPPKIFGWLRHCTKLHERNVFFVLLVYVTNDFTSTRYLRAYRNTPLLSSANHSKPPEQFCFPTCQDKIVSGAECRYRKIYCTRSLTTTTTSPRLGILYQGKLESRSEQKAVVLDNN